MYMKQTIIAAAVVAVLLAAGCDRGRNEAKDTQAAAVESSSPVSESAQPAESVVAPTSSAKFVVSPVGVSGCEGTPAAVATVSWEVADPNVGEVKVEVDNASQPQRNLLTVAGKIGDVKTEAWVVAGTRFYLVDAKTGAELASYEVIAEPCASTAAK